MPLAVTSTSGITFSPAHANRLPVRPNPVITSSQTIRIPYRVQISRILASHPSGGTMTPPTPCTGSATKAAIASGPSRSTILSNSSAQARRQLGQVFPNSQR